MFHNLLNLFRQRRAKIEFALLFYFLLWAILISLLNFLHPYLIFLFPIVAILVIKEGEIFSRLFKIFPILNKELGFLHLLGIFIVALVVALYVFRLINLSSPPYIIGFFIDTWFPFIASIGFSALFYSCGFTILRWTNYKSSSELESVVVRFGIGLGFFLLTMTALGFLQLFYVSVLIITVSLISLVSYKGFIDLFSKIKNLRVSLPVRKAGHVLPAYLLYLFIGILWIFVFINAIVPEPYHVDATRTYMSTAKVFVENHGIVSQPYDLLSHYPRYAEMFFSTAILSGNINIISIFHIILVFMSYGVLVLLHRAISGVRSSRHMLLNFFFFVPLITFSVGLLKPDGFSLFFSLLAFYFLVKFTDSKSTKHLVLTSIFAGLMIGIKYTTMVYLPGIALVFILTLKQPWEIIKKGVLSALIIITLFSPWGLHNMQTIGNPLAPAYLNVMSSEDHFLNAFGPGALPYLAEAQRSDSWLFSYYDQYAPFWYYIIFPFIITFHITHLFFTYQFFISAIFLIFFFLLFSKKILVDHKKRALLIIIASSVVFLFPVLQAQMWYILPSFALLLVLYQSQYDKISPKVKMVFYIIILLNTLPAMWNFIPTIFSSSYTAIHYERPCATTMCGKVTTNPLNDEIKEIANYFDSNVNDGELLLDLNASAGQYFFKSVDTRVIVNHFSESVGYLAQQGYSTEDIILKLQSLNIRYLLVKVKASYWVDKAVLQHSDKSKFGEARIIDNKTKQALENILTVAFKNEKFILYKVY